MMLSKTISFLVFAASIPGVFPSALEHDRNVLESSAKEARLRDRFNILKSVLPLEYDALEQLKQKLKSDEAFSKSLEMERAEAQKEEKKEDIVELELSEINSFEHATNSIYPITQTITTVIMQTLAPTSGELGIPSATYVNTIKDPVEASLSPTTFPLANEESQSHTMQDIETSIAEVTQLPKSVTWEEFHQLENMMKALIEEQDEYRRDKQVSLKLEQERLQDVLSQNKYLQAKKLSQEQESRPLKEQELNDQRSSESASLEIGESESAVKHNEDDEPTLSVPGKEATSLKEFENVNHPALDIDYNYPVDITRQVKTIPRNGKTLSQILNESPSREISVIPQFNYHNKHDTVLSKVSKFPYSRPKTAWLNSGVGATVATGGEAVKTRTTKDISSVKNLDSSIQVTPNEEGVIATSEEFDQTEHFRSNQHLPPQKEDEDTLEYLRRIYLQMMEAQLLGKHSFTESEEIPITEVGITNSVLETLTTKPQGQEFSIPTLGTRFEDDEYIYEYVLADSDEFGKYPGESEETIVPTTSSIDSSNDPSKIMHIPKQLFKDQNETRELGRDMAVSDSRQFDEVKSSLIKELLPGSQHKKTNKNHKSRPNQKSSAFNWKDSFGNRQEQKNHKKRKHSKNHVSKNYFENKASKGLHELSSYIAALVVITFCIIDFI